MPRRTGRVLLGVATALLLVFSAAALNADGERFEEASGTADLDHYDGANRYDGVVDVYPYDANGHPLSGVRLYDQNGRPIVLGDPFRCLNPLARRRAADGSELNKIDLLGRGYPLCPPTGWAPSATAGPQPGPQPSLSPAPQPSPTR
jgi:hypothetical protein